MAADLRPGGDPALTAPSGSAPGGSAPASGAGSPPVRPSRPVRLLLGALVAGLAALAAAIRVGGGLSHSAPGLQDAGRFTESAQPAATFVMNAAGTLTVGLLLMAAVFLPTSGRELPVRAYACLRAASLSAVVWALAALATAELTFSVLIGRSGLDTLLGGALLGFLTDVTQGRALVTVALLATVIAVAAHLPRTPGGAAGLLALALIALLPPAMTGHTVTSPNHSLAVYVLSVHIIAVALWVGGLVALIAAAVRSADVLPQIVPRYSTMALGCFVAIGLSGVTAAWLRLDGSASLRSGYGALLITKVMALVALGVLGWRQRTDGLPGLTGARPGRVFARIAAVEIVVMAAAMGLATGLARSHPPETGTRFNTRAALLLGYDMPGPAGPRAYALDWRFDPLWVTLLLGGAAFYAAGVLRLRRRGRHWPVSRTVGWYGGLAIVLVATCGGVARYSMVLFSAHVAQHVLLTVIAPLPLLAGAPLTLALRTLRTRTVSPGDRRPGGDRPGGEQTPGGQRPAAVGRSLRESLTGMLHSGVLRRLARPPVAAVVFVLGLYGFYISPLFESSMRNHLVHSALMLPFIAVGMLALWPIVRVQPGPYRLGRHGRLLLAGGLLAAHVVFGLVFLRSGGVLAADWYAALARAWGPSPLQDQRAAGLVVWALAVPPALLLLVVAALPDRSRTARVEDRPS